MTTSDHLFELAAPFGLRNAAETFVEYVWGFYYDLVRRGHWTEARSKTEQLIAVARTLSDKQTEARAIGELGSRYQDIGEYGRAAELHQKAQHLFAESKDKRGVAAALHQRGMLAQAQGDYGEAVRLYQQSLKLEEEVGYERGIASTLHELGRVALKQGNHNEAARLYQQSLALDEKLGDKEGLADTLHELGRLAQHHGDYSEAARLYQQSLRIEEELERKTGIASSLGQLGRLAYAQGQLKEALGYFIRAFVIFEELHAPYRQLALKYIASVRDAVGESQFAVWLKELSTEAERINELLERNKPNDEQRAKEFTEQLIGIARAVVAARKQGSAEEQAELAQQLAQMEANARVQNAAEVADFLVVLCGLLVGEDVTDKIAALVEPLKGIAEQARAACI